VPLVALAGIAPWLWNIRDLLGSDIVSPFVRSPDYWQVMVLYHGIWIVPAAGLGAVIGLRARRQVALFAVGWLVLALDFAVIGLLEALLPGLLAPVLRYDYPFSIAWHAPIIPYAVLGGIGLLWLWDRWAAKRLEAVLQRRAPLLLGGLMALCLLAGVFSREILAFSKGRVAFFGAFASHDDVAAMRWLRENTPPDARILNFPGSQADNSHEGDWVPVISERDSVYYRWQPFFRGNEGDLAEQERMRAFWLNPADPANADLLRAANIRYVIVPQIVTAPERIATMFRWRAPFSEAIVMQSAVSEAPYLRLVFEADGAQVYEVVD
jgi:hypothetical protein